MFQSLTSTINQLKFPESIFSKEEGARMIALKILGALCILITIGLSFYLCNQYFNLNLWRHDSIEHTPEVSWYKNFNLKEEGRWLNYLLWNGLKLIPASIASILSIIFLSTYGFLCAQKVHRSTFISLLFGSSLALIPAFTAQNLWPNLTLPSVALLVLIFYAAKKLHPYIIYLFSAILFFGALSNTYFLVPLIYIKEVRNGLTQNFRKDLIFFTKSFLFPFVSSFIVGFFVANLIVYLFSGDTIQLAAFRKPNPIENFEGFIINLTGIIERVHAFVIHTVSDIHIALLVLMILFLLLSLRRSSFWMISLFLIIFLSPFVTTLYHGIVISNRTLYVSTIALLSIFFFIPYKRFPSNALYSILFLGLSYSQFKASNNELSIFGKITNFYSSQVENISELEYGHVFQGIIVFADRKDIVRINRQITNYADLEFKWAGRLNSSERTLITALRGHGYYNVYKSEDPKRQKQVLRELKLKGNSNHLVSFTLKENPSILCILLHNTELSEEELKQL